jgi:polyisoprenoid-binding protein YceI
MFMAFAQHHHNDPRHCDDAQHSKTLKRVVRAHRASRDPTRPFVGQNRAVQPTLRGLPTAGRIAKIPSPIPPGRYEVIPERSEIGFTARHLLVTQVRGTFSRFGGVVTTGTLLEEATVDAWLDPASVATGDRARDEHLRSPDFFDVERFPRWRLAGKLVGTRRGLYLMLAELTICDVTREVWFEVDYDDPVLLDPASTAASRSGDDGQPPRGRRSNPATRARAVPAQKGAPQEPLVHVRAEATVDRRDFGLTWSATIERGGIVVGERVGLLLDVVLRAEG